MIAGVVAAVITSVAVVIWLRAIWVYTMHRGALGVVRALRRHPDEQYTVRVHSWVPMVGAWNPSQPLRRSPQVFGDGVATYRLDSTDQVHMRWTPRTGAAREYHGEIPAQLDIGHPEHHKRAVLLRAVVVVYAVAVIVGFTIGYTLASGRPTQRIGFGLAGVFVAMVVLWIAVTAAQVTRGTRDAVGRRRRQDTTTRAR